MRIENAWPSRPNYYDRNPVYAPQYGFSVQNGGLGQIVLVTYTVPANRLALITSADLRQVRTALAVTLGNTAFALLYMLAGVQQGAILDLLTMDNCGERFYEKHSALNAVIPPGDGIRIALQDFSVGGTVWYEFGVYIVEFDQ